VDVDGRLLRRITLRETLDDALDGRQVVGSRDVKNDLSGRGRNAVSKALLDEKEGRERTSAFAASFEMTSSLSNDPLTGLTPNSSNLATFLSSRLSAEIEYWSFFSRRAVRTLPPMKPVPRMKSCLTIVSCGGSRKRKLMRIRRRRSGS
jgi:hypothetical protein